MSGSQTERRVWPIIVEVGLAVLFIYFLFGYSWRPWVWAAFTIFAVWVVVMNLQFPPESEIYQKWKVAMGLLLVLVLIVSGLVAFVQNGSWWLLVVGLIVVALWIDDFRCYRRVWEYRRRRQP